MIYEDLLSVPFKAKGRDHSGMDCYGLVIECCRRCGLDLHDVVYATEKVDKEKLSCYVQSLNVKEIDEPKKHAIVQCEYKGRLHIGFMIDKNICLHETYEGVRLIPVTMLQNRKYFEVNK
jgi:hypothetical protein